jgi:hypothetical protein
MVLSETIFPKVRRLVRKGIQPRVHDDPYDDWDVHEPQSHDLRDLKDGAPATSEGRELHPACHGSSYVVIRRGFYEELVDSWSVVGLSG